VINMDAKNSKPCWPPRVVPPGAVDIGSTTLLQGEPHAAVVTKRGEQYRGNFQKMYDEGIQIALKYFGE
jgi:hypothetical protein